MKIDLECVSCISSHAVSIPRRLTSDPAAQEAILRETLCELAEFDRSATPPEMGAMLCRVICSVLGETDPFLEQKRRLNAQAQELLPELRRRVESASDPFATAIRAAIAGNVIDFGAPGGVTEGLQQELLNAFERPLGAGSMAALERLRTTAMGARSILYLADNAGEIVFDRLLVEQLPRGTVTVVVRSGPALNDALLEDAEAVGLDEIAEVVGSGSTIPGTLLGGCFSSFVERFRAADVIISKGQGNFETLSDEPGPIWFLLRAKCDVVARHLGCAMGEHVVSESRGAV